MEEKEGLSEENCGAEGVGIQCSGSSDIVIENVMVIGECRGIAVNPTATELEARGYFIGNVHITCGLPGSNFTGGDES